jgi:hypothetical protein
MSLTTPIIDTITGYDATNSYTITFTCGGDFVGTILKIEKAISEDVTTDPNIATSDNDWRTVYSAHNDNTNLFYTIPANTLENGYIYRCFVTSYEEGTDVSQFHNPSAGMNEWVAFGMTEMSGEERFTCEASSTPEPEPEPEQPTPTPTPSQNNFVPIPNPSESNTDMSKPVGVALNAFDARYEQIVNFNVTGGKQVIGNILIISEYHNAEDGTDEDGQTSHWNVVYANSIQSYAYRHIIPAYKLTNGKRYRYSIQTFGVDANVSQQGNHITVTGNDISTRSNYVEFYCNSKPSLRISNMPSTSTIENGNYVFNAIYESSENVRLKEAVFYLYGSDLSLKQQSDKITPQTNPPNTLTWNCEGLIDDEIYYIEILGKTVEGQECNSSRLKFVVDYSYEGTYLAITATNDPERGFVQINNNISEIDGHVFNKYDKEIPPTFIDSSLLYLNNGDYLKWDSGYQISTQRCTVQKWWKPIWWGKTLEMKDGDPNKKCVIELKRAIPQGEEHAKDYIVATYYDDGVIKGRKASAFVNCINNNAYLTTWFQANGQQINLSMTTAEGGSHIEWNGISDITYGTTTMLTWNNEQANYISNILDFDTGQSNVEYNKITNIFWSDEPEAEEFTDTTISSLENIDVFFTDTRLYNSYLDMFYATHDVSRLSPYEGLPKWDGYTIMSAKFDNNLVAGNVDWMLTQIDSIKLKRKIVGTDKWITIMQRPLRTIEDLYFVWRDYYVPSGGEFEYAMIPCSGVKENAYFTTQVKTKFNGVFISDSEQTIKLYGNYLISSSQDNIAVGQVQTYYAKYPTITRNPYVLYNSFSIQGDVLGISENQCTNFNFDRQAIVKQRDAWRDFLCNGRAKIVKDWNGNIWLAHLTVAPSYVYQQTSSNGIPTITFGMTEQGKYDNQSDLYNHRLIDVPVT